MEETLQLTSQSVSQVFSFSATAVEHCSLLTEGWGVCALVKTLEVGPIFIPPPLLQLLF